jgi:hypothetical protein
MSQERISADAVISLQGNPDKGHQLLRSRVPGAIIDACGGEHGDAFHYEITGPGRFVGTLVQGGAAQIERKPPTPPTRTAKAGAKASTKRPTKGNGSDPFADDDDDVFGGSAKPVRAAAKPAAVKPVAAVPSRPVAARPAAAKPVAARPVASKGRGYSVPK